MRALAAVVRVSGWEIALWTAIVFLNGLLLLHFGEVYFDVTPNAEPVLFGNYLLPSLGCLLMSGAAIAFAVYWLARSGVDTFSLAVFILAALVSLHYLHLSSNSTKTNDWYQHLEKAIFISQNWSKGYDFWGREYHHPPGYYYLAAVVIRIAGLLQTIPLITAVKFISWLSFLGFNAFSLLTLRCVPGLNPMAYRLCAVLLLCWPASIHLACKVSNEPLYFAFYAAAFYFMLRWYYENKPSQLVAALLLAGITLTVKSSAIFLFLLCGVFMLVAWRRGRFQLNSLSNVQCIAVANGLLALVLINCWQIISNPISAGKLSRHWGYGLPEPYPASHFMFMDVWYYLRIPFVNWSRNQSFWDYLFKTSIYGEYVWFWPNVAMVLNGLLLVMVLYTFLPWLSARRNEWRGLLPLALGLLLPVIFLIIFMAWKHAPPNQDARLIYPALVCFIAWFGRSLSLAFERGALGLMGLGIGLPISFSTLSLVFFWFQAR